MKNNTLKIVKIVCPLIIMLLSIFVLSNIATSPAFHAKSIAALDEKKTTVMELTAASTAASAAITLLPGDTATPIADKLADLSTYFIIVVCAIFLEKYLLTITGFLSFDILIPAACFLFIINVFWKNDTCKLIIKRILLFAFAAVMIIPLSIRVSNMVEDTYKSSIDNTIQAAKEVTEDTQKASDQGLFSDIISKVTDGISKITNNIVDKVEDVLNNLIEALAVMIVTSCLIPVLVLLFFVWLLKLVLGSHIDIFKNKI